jgi:hypothetical protein
MNASKPWDSWASGNSRLAILLFLRGFSSEGILLLPGVWKRIVHRLFTPTYGSS